MAKNLTAALAALTLSALCACASAQRTAVPVPAQASSPAIASGSPDSFFAVVAADGNAVEQVSAQSGASLRQIASGERDGLPVTGLARLSQNTLLVTYGTGPACSSNVAGCGPLPNTCGAEVEALNLQTGAITLLWRLGRDQRLSHARPSPDGTKIAALASPCVPPYFNEHLVVRRLSDGNTWTIGGQTPRCHALGAPEWTADNAHLLVTYAPPTGTHPYTGPDGGCTSTGDSKIVEVDAGHPQPLIAGMASAAPPGCTYRALASTGVRIYAVQACGPDDTRLQGPAALVQLDQSLRVKQRWPIGYCTDGNDLAAAPGKGVILTAYLFCNPPLGDQKPAEPITALDRLDGTSLRRIAIVGHGGGTPFAYLTW